MAAWYLTVRDIHNYRINHPEGTHVAVPVQTVIGEGKRRRAFHTIGEAAVLETHPRVVVTTRGTFQWTDVILAERGVAEVGESDDD